MKKRQYKRLFLVLFGPLLIAGIINSIYFSRFDDFRYLLCEPSFLGNGENCRDIPYEHRLYKKIQQDHPAWFDVSNYLNDGPISFNVQASNRYIAVGQFLEATPFFGSSPEATKLMKEIVGRQGGILLGIQKNEKSALLPGHEPLLTCNRLDFFHEAGIYAAGCYGEHWSGSVKFSVDGNNEKILKNLKFSIAKSVEEATKEYRIYQFVMYPLFIYLFLIVSFIFYAIKASVKYVKIGPNRS